jgi:hypothetical protein
MGNHRIFPFYIKMCRCDWCYQSSSLGVLWHQISCCDQLPRISQTYSPRLRSLAAQLAVQYSPLHPPRMRVAWNGIAGQHPDAEKFAENFPDDQPA